jgi:hypothetical protein
MSYGEFRVLDDERRDTSNARIAWQLRRDDASARCLLLSSDDRVELHITITHDVVMSQQCSGREQAEAVSSAWWSALVERGWSDTTSRVTVIPKRDRRASYER